MTATSQASKRKPAQAWIDALAATATIAAAPDRLLPHVIEAQASVTPDAAALLSDSENFSFADLARRIDAYAAWSLAVGLKAGDCVALLMRNRPDYLAIWLGLSKAGVVTALLNTSLTGEALRHCIRLAGPRALICETPFLGVARDTLADCAGMAQPPRLWCHGGTTADAPTLELPETTRDMALPRVMIDDTALLIYTSGTTGLPKAARVSHRRVLTWALWFKGLLGNTEADRMYDCLPLFHSVGGVVAALAPLVAGGSTVIAERFSASRFWPDVRRWDCTQVQYIGEICRYLLAAPEAADETRHRLRIACGNGLREDVWPRFQERFAIPQIVEFYAATEGTFSLYNVEGKPGAIGRTPPYLRHRFPTAIVKFDPLTEQPLRGEDGRCIRCAPGEAGEAIGRIGTGEGGGRFEGYTDATDSARKVLRDVFEPGDRWFRTGDLMRMDAAGFYYFVDRIGDTFRWKGENVSTLEVVNVLAAVPGIADVTVYGVPVPQAEGKAGMAMIVAGEGFSVADVWRAATARLPAYAVPVFLRVGVAIALTDTFKHQKQQLVRDGFDAALCAADCLFVKGEDGYVPLDPVAANAVATGRWRF